MNTLQKLSHFNETDEEARLADFAKFLGDYVVHYKHISHLVRDEQTAPESEITIDQFSNQDK
jgi:ribonuclease HIII